MVEIEQSKESAIENARQDTRLDAHEQRITRLEDSTEALLQSNAALMASVEQTNRLMSEGFGMMKKLVAGVAGILTVVFGGSQVVM